MQCPQCRFDNREGAKFCRTCGKRLELSCPSCGHVYESDSVFCDECGHRFGDPTSLHAEKRLPETDGERKYATVLFSDLSGYTAMSERLDPEEVKEITSRIFGEAAKVIRRYEGFVEKYVGDAVMALFGVPEAHEDDPVRAIRAAREIHQLVEEISPEIEKRIGRPIAMHSGINTGLVVTGEVDLEKGTHGVAGDTINLAARLSALAKPGEIIAGYDTFRQAEGYFDFEEREPTSLKGKAEPVIPYRMVSAKEKPSTLHRLSGLKARLIGRNAEVEELREAVERLKAGQGRIFAICGEAGTGKSRLVQEFKESLEPEDVQWLEAHAYAYTQHVPYYPLVDLFNRIFGIEENDRPKRIREKIEASLSDLLDDRRDLVPYVGSLYSLDYPEIEDVSPEYWKARLQEAVQSILSALAGKMPTVFFLEDLHWADPSFGELLRSTLQEVRSPAVVLCVYRPGFSLFPSHLLETFKNVYREIRLQDLSASEVLEMLKSLLQTDQVPSELHLFVRDKAEGNPFFLEELVNSLIESDILTKDNGNWKLSGPITESNISSTVHGIVSGRLDRLEGETKRVLQEASVIGRTFLQEILRAITEQKEHCERCLMILERLDLIRTKALQPHLEYIFKHALTQEVVYNGLLKRQRRDIHERIGLVMEQLFEDRLPEFYETLAYHFQEGKSSDKALKYLMKAGEKSLKRYAVEESNLYYKNAFEILKDKSNPSKNDEDILIGHLIEWAYVFYYRGDFKSLTELYSAHEKLARSLDDRSKTSMFFAWFGFGLLGRQRFRESYQYLHKALQIAEDIQDQKIIGYACTWLTWTCGELGLNAEASGHGEMAQEISRRVPHDQYLYFKSLAGMAQLYVFKGEIRKAFDAGKTLLIYGKKYSNMRSTFLGYVYMGYSAFQAGNFSDAIENAYKAVKVSVDPMYSMAGRLLPALIHAYTGKFDKMGNAPHDVADFGKKFGCEMWGTIGRLLLGVIQVSEGHMNKGMKEIETVQSSFLKNERKWYLCLSEQVIGKIYLQLVENSTPISIATITKNIGFLAKNILLASKKAECHLQRSIDIAKEINAKGLLAQAFLELGMLYKAKKRTEKARNCFSEAIHAFEECGADGHLKRVQAALSSLM